MSIGKKISAYAAVASMVAGFGVFAAGSAMADAPAVSLKLDGQAPTNGAFAVTSSSVEFSLRGCTPTKDAPAEEVKGQVVLADSSGNNRAWADILVSPSGSYSVKTFRSSSLEPNISEAEATADYSGEVTGTLSLQGLTLGGAKEVTVVASCGGGYYYGAASGSTVSYNVSVPKTVDPAFLNAPLEVVPGQEVDLSLGGFLAGEQVEVELHSTPVKLLGVKAGLKGAVAAKARIPDNTTAGKHKFVVKGLTSKRQVVVDVLVKAKKSAGQASTGGTKAVQGPAKGGQLAKTGANGVVPVLATAAVLTAAGAFLLRRKRAA